MIQNTRSDIDKRITKTILDQAKAFLCWDIFRDLSIQLVEVQEVVSYYHPPLDRSSIIVYYERGNKDFSFPLFLLFHEVGHYLQFHEMRENGREDDFQEMIDNPTGPANIKFEEESWSKGKRIFEKFIKIQNLDESLLKDYDRAAEESIRSYR